MVAVDTVEDVRVCALHNEIAGNVLPLNAPGGTLRCVIPKLSLAQGRYRLTVKLKVNDRVAFYLPKVFPLSVGGGDFFGTGRLPEQSWGGLCYLDSTWQALSDKSLSIQQEGV